MQRSRRSSRHLILTSRHSRITGAVNFIWGASLDDKVTYAATSNRMRFNSAGVLEYAPHNLLAQSEQFDGASWVKTSITVTPNNAANPIDGATTADTLTASGANGTCLQTLTLVATTYAEAYYIKRRTGTGNIQLTVDGTTFTTVAVTDAWERLDTSLLVTAGSKTIGLRIVTSGDAIDVFGAQLNIGALQPYYPSTPKNLLGYTNDFDNAAWVKSSMTVTKDSVADPWGVGAAETLTATGANATILQTITLTATPYDGSIYLQRKTGTGTVEFTLDGVTYNTVAFVSGWARISTTKTPTAGAKTFGIRIVTSGDEVYVSSAQLSDSASLDPYVYNPVAAPSASAYYGPAFEYDPVTLAPLGIDAYGALTNQVRNSVCAGAAAGTPGTIFTNGSVSGLGTLTQSIATGTYKGIPYFDWTLSGTTSTTQVSLRFDTTGAIAASNGQVWTLSYFNELIAGQMTNITGAFAGCNIFDGASGYIGEITMGSTPSPTSTFSRSVLSGTIANASTASIRPYFSFTFASGVSINITVRLMAPQLVQSNVAGPVILTYGAAATRTADSIGIYGSNFSSWYNQTEGTFVVRWAQSAAPASGVNLGLIEARGASFNDSVSCYVTGILAPQFNVNVGGAAQASITSAAGALNTAQRIAVAYQQDNFGSSFMGATVGTDISGTVPATTSFLIGNIASGQYGNCTFAGVSYYPRRVTNTELQALNAS